MALFDEAILTWRLREGRVAGLIDERFEIMEGRPNGGYLLALCAAAGRSELSAQGALTLEPVASTAIFIAPAGTGPCEFAVELLRIGKSAAHVQVTLLRDEQACVVATLVYGQLDSSALRHVHVDPIEMPSPEDCIAMGGRDSSPRLMETMEMLADPATMAWAMGSVDGCSEQRAWLGFHDGRNHDAMSLLLALDALPPATFGLGSLGWVPTLSMTAYVLAQPAAGRIRVRQRAVLVSEDAVDEICDVVDSRGQVVAQASQLARLRFA